MHNAGRASGSAARLTDETSISKWHGQKAVIVQFQPVKTGRCQVKITQSVGKVGKRALRWRLCFVRPYETVPIEVDHMIG